MNEHLAAALDVPPQRGLQRRRHPVELLGRQQYRIVAGVAEPVGSPLVRVRVAPQKGAVGHGRRAAAVRRRSGERRSRGARHSWAARHSWGVRQSRVPFRPLAELLRHAAAEQDCRSLRVAGVRPRAARLGKGISRLSGTPSTRNSSCWPLTFQRRLKERDGHLLAAGHFHCALEADAVETPVGVLLGRIEQAHGLFRGGQVLQEHPDLDVAVQGSPAAARAVVRVRRGGDADLHVAQPLGAGNGGDEKEGQGEKAGSRPLPSSQREREHARSPRPLAGR